MLRTNRESGNRWFRKRNGLLRSSQSNVTTFQPDASETSIPSELLVAYTGEDLLRWREVLGCRTRSRDARRGVGRLLDVRWATHGAGVAPHIQVCISYERGLTSWIRGGAFAEVHTEIGVPRALGAMLDTAARDLRAVGVHQAAGGRCMSAATD